MADFIRISIEETFDKVPEGGAMFRFAGTERSMRRLFRTVVAAVAEYMVDETPTAREFEIPNETGDPVMYVVEVDHKYKFALGVGRIQRQIANRPDSGVQDVPILRIMTNVENAARFTDAFRFALEEVGSWFGYAEYKVNGEPTNKYMAAALVLPAQQAESLTAQSVTETDSFLDSVLAGTGVVKS